MEEVKNALLIEYDKDSYHQHIKIDNIEIAMHYNYLIDRFFLNVWADDEFVASNIPIYANVNLFDNLYYPIRNNENQEAIMLGELIFSYHEKTDIKKDDLGKFEIIFVGDQIVYS